MVTIVDAVGAEHLLPLFWQSLSAAAPHLAQRLLVIAVTRAAFEAPPSVISLTERHEQSLPPVPQEQDPLGSKNSNPRILKCYLHREHLAAI